MFWNYKEAFDELIDIQMNLKHEMFWNFSNCKLLASTALMNLKHEMFWNKMKKISDIFLPHEP